MRSRATPCRRWFRADLLASDSSDKIFAYFRVEGKEKFAIVLNFSDENTTFPFPLKGTKVIGNYGDEAAELRSWEAVIYKLDT